MAVFSGKEVADNDEDYDDEDDDYEVEEGDEVIVGVTMENVPATPSSPSWDTWTMERLT